MAAGMGWRCSAWMSSRCWIITPRQWTFRTRQRRLFEGILESFGIAPEPDRVDLFINLSLAVIVLSRAIPQTLPMFVPDAARESTAFQIRCIVDWLESLREQPGEQR